MADQTRIVDVRLHDTSIGIWQDSANDPSFRREVYLPLLALLRRRKWKVAADPRVHKHYPSISKDHRLAERGDMRVEVSVSGRAIQLQFWAETWPIDNPNGRRYDFGKRAKMADLDRVRLDLETRKIMGWLSARATVTISTADRPRGMGPGEITALEYIERSYADSWHSDKTLGRPVCSQPYNAKSGDGDVIEHGERVWFIDGKGRILRGTALYNINNMWWVVTDRYGLSNKGSHEIFVRQPDRLRAKRNDRARRSRLEGELAAAIRRCDFRRAELLKGIIFGADPTYGIWSRKQAAYYRPNRSGYTTDALSAGRYTWEEATDEVRRVPDILSLVMPDGRHIQAEALDRQVAA